MLARISSTYRGIYEENCLGVDDSSEIPIFYSIMSLFDFTSLTPFSAFMGPACFRGWEITGYIYV